MPADLDPRVLLVICGIAISVWLGGESIKGLRWVKHHVQAVAHSVLHPGEKQVK